MNITVEFSGIARIVTGTRQVTLEVSDGTSFRQVIRLLGQRYPQLVGEVIHADGETLQASNMLNVNGKRMVQPAQMDNRPDDGDRLILMSVLAGG